MIKLLRCLTALAGAGLCWVGAGAQSPPGWAVNSSPGGIPIHTNISGSQMQVVLCATTVRDGIIYAWRDNRTGTSGTDIYAQKLTPCGTLAPGWPASGLMICNAVGDQDLPQIIPDGSDGAIIVWEDDRFSTTDVYAQHVSGAGATTWTPNGVAVCNLTTGNQRNPHLCTDGAGGAIFAFDDNRNGTYDIYAQKADAAGVLQWGTGLPVCVFAGTQDMNAIATDNAGGAFFAWEDARPAATGTDVYAMRLDASGAPVAGWLPNGTALSTQGSSQTTPCIANTGGQTAMFAWADGNGTGQSIQGSRLNGTGGLMTGWNAQGNLVGNAITSSGNPGTASTPRIAADCSGGAYISYRSPYGGGDNDVLTRYMQPTGGQGAFEYTAFGTNWEGDHEIAPNGLGGAFNVFEDHNNPSVVEYRLFGSTTVVASAGTNARDNANLAAMGGVGYFAWEDARPGTISGDLYGGCSSSLAPPPILNSSLTTTFSASSCAFPTQNVTACSGTSITFTVPLPAGLFNTYTFLDGVTVLQTGSSNVLTTSALTVGTHTITATSAAGGCVTAPSNQIVITVTNSPTPSIVTQTNVSCNGGTNGSVTANATGGTPAYAYSWAPSGGTSATASGLPAGNYTCTITDANGCTATQSVSITQPALLDATPSSTPATCGGTNGTATATGTGGVGPYTYSWAPSGGTSSTATGLAAGNYTCTVTDANSCTHNEIVTVTNSGGPTVSPQSQSDVSCNGGADGAAAVSASSGTPPYTYSWSPSGGTGSSASGLSAGTYTCTVTDANLCAQALTVTITEPGAITSSAGSTDALCNGGATGSATVTPAGGTGTYTYSWAPNGGTSATASGLLAGNYTCTITDANGCSATQAVNVSEPTALSSTATQIDPTCNGGANGQATANPGGGTGTYTYSWSPGGSTNATATGLSAVSYTCTITDANGCTTTQTVLLTEPSAISTTMSFTPATCGNNNGTATASSSGGSGTYTYFWPASGTVAATDTNLVAGPYTCIITDANGCTDTASINVTNANGPVLTLASQTNVTCNAAADGTAAMNTANGTGPFTYSWMPSGGTSSSASGLAPGTYTCTVTDANNCTHSETVTITEPAALTTATSWTDATCGNANGTGTATPSGGTGTYTYAWVPGGGSNATVAGLPAGTFTCFISDANGCADTVSVTITSTPSPALSLSSTGTTCSTTSDGSAAASATSGTPPFTYSWSSGGTGATENNLAPGTYTCTVTDSNSCVVTQTVIVTSPPAITVNATPTNPLCNGGTGSITATPSGGTGTFTYSWSSGGTSATENNLSQGTYTVTVTDANGCTQTQTAGITQPALLAASATSTPGCGTNNGTAIASGTGGTGAYTYSWSPGGGTTATASGLATGTYTCTITDANNCTSTATVSVTSNANPTAAVTPATATIMTGAGVSLSAAGGTSYSWSPAGGLSCTNCANPTASPTQTTNYCVIATDGNGCTDTACVTVTVDTECGEIFIPSAFSPNGDHENDLLCIYGNRCITEMSFVIYDRWGEKVFQSTDPALCWDGVFPGAGEMMNTAVFVYHLKATLVNGQQLEKKGNISLVK